jgi:hypothetical protein
MACKNPSHAQPLARNPSLSSSSAAARPCVRLSHPVITASHGSARTLLARDLSVRAFGE